MSQLSILPAIDPDELVALAVDAHHPVATVALCSGGKDSTVLAHRCREHFTELAYIDTGTAIPGVREFVADFAEWLGKPLRVLESGDAFRNLVLGVEGRSPALGFPGPAQHNRAYNQLKERQLRVLRAELQDGRKRRVLFLAGVRRGESARRRSRSPITREGSMVFANPLIDWTDDECREYAAEHAIPESPVAALLHKSGECNCGSFAAPGEREMIEALWPAWFDATIRSLEREAEAAGIHACRWGERPGVPDFDPGALCTDCQLSFLDAAASTRVERNEDG